MADPPAQWHKGGELVMRDLWHDITTHRRAAALALVVWLVSLIPWLAADEFLLLQFPLMIIAGSLAAWWRTTA
jgi:hypothetical protein